jgi:hypothetical protein
MPSGRPASINTRAFRRTLSDSEAAILANAGNGDMSQGFKNVMDIYRALYLRGYDSTQDIDCFLDNYQDRVSNSF